MWKGSLRKLGTAEIKPRCSRAGHSAPAGLARGPLRHAASRGQRGGDGGTAHLGASARVERRAVSPRDTTLGAGSAVREAVMACIVLESCRASGALGEMDGPEARSTAEVGDVALWFVETPRQRVQGAISPTRNCSRLFARSRTSAATPTR